MSTDIAQRERDVFGPLEAAARLPAGCLTMVGLDLRDVSMEFADWQELGRALGHVQRWGAWALGDWLNFGVSVFGDDAYNATEGTVGDRYDLAHRVTGLAAETLHNYASICGQIPRSNRRVELSFSTHEPVAKLDHEHQGPWLQKAVENRWRREDLRSAIRESAASDGTAAAGANGSGGGRVNIYERRDEAARLVLKLAQPAEGGRFVPDEPWAQLVAAYGGEQVVRATMKNGETVKLHADEGATPEAVRAHVEEAAKSALTGSAMPAVTLKTADGDHVLYAAVERLDPEPDS